VKVIRFISKGCKKMGIHLLGVSKEAPKVNHGATV